MTKKPFDLNDPCIFCNPKVHEILAQNKYAQIIKDNSPVSEGHCIIIPKRHMKTQFDLTPDETLAIATLIQKAKLIIEKQGLKPDGYNIGSNNGMAAGQSVFHLHVHVIPRYLGDVEQPKGGIRQVIPNKSQYNLADRKD
jgi:diadenosine tetraphosphate (Ap4A) HIT family hydrolase